MHRPGVVFKSLEIPTYLIWDNDSDCKPREVERNKNLNRQLLKLVGAKEMDWPEGVWGTHSCLGGNLEKTLRRDMSDDVFFSYRDKVLEEFKMKAGKGGKKNPHVLRRTVEEAAEDGQRSDTLSQIVSAIVGVLQARGDALV